MGRRRAVAVLVAGVVAALLAGCGPVTTSTAADHQRLSLLEDDRLVRASMVDDEPAAGWRAAGALERSTVSGTFTDWDGIDDASVKARAQMVIALRLLRQGGWRVYFADCLPPQPAPATPAADQAVEPDVLPIVWQFDVQAYKVVDGVSYAARVHGDAYGRHRVLVFFTLLAPYSQERSADLFPDRPAALAAGSTCIEQPVVHKVIRQGTPIVVDDSVTGAPATGHR